MKPRIAIFLLLSVSILSLGYSPKDTIPFSRQEVTYPGADPGVTLSGTLFLPRKGKKPPVVLLIPGTGQQDRTARVGPHAYYDTIVAHLCRQGIAVLWTDDRGVGKSTGNFEDATTADFARDAAAGVDFLKTQRKIDPRHIGLLGHSEGGTMAILAAAQNKNVAFMISLAGVATNGLAAVIRQNEGIVSTSPISQSEKTAYDSINGRLFRTIHDHIDAPDIDSLLKRTFLAWKKETPADVLAGMRFDSYRGDRYIERFMALPYSRWYRYMILSDPADALRQIDVPVLAINGDRDIMVDADENLEAFRKHLKPGLDVTLRKMPGLNHMLQHCVTCTPDEYVKLEEAVSGEVLDIVSSWIKQRT